MVGGRWSLVNSAVPGRESQWAWAESRTRALWDHGEMFWRAHAHITEAEVGSLRISGGSSGLSRSGRQAMSPTVAHVSACVLTIVHDH